MNRKALALVGAALLAIGLFTPLVALPIVGAVNLFGNGSNPVALALLALAVLIATLTAKDRLAELVWPGVSAAVLLLFHFVRIQSGIAKMRESMQDLADNPFGGVAIAAMQTVQFQWGWIPLAAGAALTIYVGWTAQREQGTSWHRLSDRPAKLVAAAAAACLLVPIAIGLTGDLQNAATTSAGPAGAAPTGELPAAAAPAAEMDTPEEIAYARDHLQLYDLRARYFDSLLDGSIPGVRFKIKNNGSRTLTEVEVKVVFYDKDGKAIAEETYHPVLVSEYNYGNDNKPLRPNYIWQQEPDSFYAAKAVPSEWEVGKATATITSVKFGGEP